jgi:hypothetical protein
MNGRNIVFGSREVCWKKYGNPEEDILVLLLFLFLALLDDEVISFIDHGLDLARR